MKSTTFSWQKQKQPWFLPPPGRSAVDQLENNHLEDFKIYWSELMILQIRLIREWLPDFLTTAMMVVVVVASLNIVQTLNWWVAKLNLKAASHDVIQIMATAKGWVKKRGLALTHNYVNPNEFCDFNHIVKLQVQSQIHLNSQTAQSFRGKECLMSNVQWPVTHDPRPRLE